MMVTLIADAVSRLEIPSWVVDFASFRRWTDTGEFPENGRICFLRGGVWADMSKEQIFSHNQVKREITRVLSNWLIESKAGRFFPDGLRIINESAEISNVPDGTYVSFDTLRAGRAKYVANKDGFAELGGVPDLVIEVVSPSSEDKDTEWLAKSYWEAGIPEYWLIDARRRPVSFTVFRHGPKGYAAVRPRQGWVKSAVLGPSFRLSAVTNGMGQPDYRLDVR